MHTRDIRKRRLVDWNCSPIRLDHPSKLYGPNVVFCPVRTGQSPDRRLGSMLVMWTTNVACFGVALVQPTYHAAFTIQDTVDIPYR